MIDSPARPTRAPSELAGPLASVGWSGASMGGQVAVHVACADASAAQAERDAARTGARIEAWAARLTRFTTTSDLAALNADPWSTQGRVRPTLAAVLRWAEEAVDPSEGAVDVTLLDARLAAEHPNGRAGDLAAVTGAHAADQGTAGVAQPERPSSRRWWLQRGSRGGIVHRLGGVRFDLDGVAKGWIADRALALLAAWPGALVDADGDIAIAIGPGVEWLVGVADPRDSTASADEAPLLGTLRLAWDGSSGQLTLGVATSGTSVHRWRSGDEIRHHLIDPATGLPSRTDVVQATVIAGSARVAEALAKSVVILGSDAGLGLLERAGVQGGMILLESGEVIATPQTLAWLA